jgi:hypothetical protein
MTRSELYALVWQEPMTKLAKRFKLSDVGLRKICTKHGIHPMLSRAWFRGAGCLPDRICEHSSGIKDRAALTVGDNNRSAEIYLTAEARP